VDALPFSWTARSGTGIRAAAGGGFRCRPYPGLLQSGSRAATVDYTEAAPGNGRLVRVALGPAMGRKKPSMKSARRPPGLDAVTGGSAVSAKCGWGSARGIPRRLCPRAQHSRPGGLEHLTGARRSRHQGAGRRELSGLATTRPGVGQLAQIASTGRIVAYTPLARQAAMSQQHHARKKQHGGSITLTASSPPRRCGSVVGGRRGSSSGAHRPRQQPWR